MIYENGRIAGRPLSPRAGRGTVRGLGHFMSRNAKPHQNFATSNERLSETPAVN